MVDHQLLTVDYFPVVCYKLAWDQAPQWWKKAKQGVWGGPFPSQDYLSALFDCQFFFISPTPIFSPFSHNTEPGPRLFINFRRGQKKGTEN